MLSAYNFNFANITSTFSISSPQNITSRRQTRISPIRVEIPGVFPYRHQRVVSSSFVLSSSYIQSRYGFPVPYYLYLIMTFQIHRHRGYFRLGGDDILGYDDEVPISRCWSGQSSLKLKFYNQESQPRLFEPYLVERAGRHDHIVVGHWISNGRYLIPNPPALQDDNSNEEYTPKHQSIRSGTVWTTPLTSRRSNTATIATTTALDSLYMGEISYDAFYHRAKVLFR